jgi:predicted alpha-1,2-mannosidase
MIGTHLDAVFADAFTKGIDGWNAEEAYCYARKNAFHVPPDGAPYGRVGLAHYLRLGYVPEDLVEHGASRTMDFAYGDYCLAQMAHAYGESGDAETLLQRAGWYANIYDPAVGFLRGRREDGSFSKGFDPIRWGGPYVEGSAWQCGLAVYHDVAGLAALLAGGRPGTELQRDGAIALEARLDGLMNAPATFDSGAYGYEIHEMSEMATVDFGQYAHSNQPSHHIPFLYTLTRNPWKADHIVRSVLEQLYDASPRGFCGDEDNGEMSCWYLLASLGAYQICPGKPEYTLTAPLFEEVVLEPENGPRLRILAPGNSRNTRFVGGVTLRDRSVDGRSISHQDLRNGGDVVFTMKRMP